MDAAEILPRAQVFAYQKGGSFSAFSNWFRYKLLHARGNWWVDTDVVCLSAEWPGEPRQVGYEDLNEKINGAVIRAQVGDQMMAEAFRIAESYGQDITWGMIGPKLVTQLIATRQYDYKVWDAFKFYPVFHETFTQLLDPSFAKLDELQQLGAVGLHLWNEMFRIYKIDKTVAPPAQSLLWQCFERYNLLHLFTQQYSYDAAKQRLVGPLPITGT